MRSRQELKGEVSKAHPCTCAFSTRGGDQRKYEVYAQSVFEYIELRARLCRSKASLHCPKCSDDYVKHTQITTLEGLVLRYSHCGNFTKFHKPRPPEFQSTAGATDEKFCWEIRCLSDNRALALAWVADSA